MFAGRVGWSRDYVLWLRRVCSPVEYHLIGATVNGDGEKSPDFALAFPQIERKRFLVGETGFSDSGEFTRRRIKEWLTDGRGDVCVIIIIINVWGD